jgi:hypothetical protein
MSSFIFLFLLLQLPICLDHITFLSCGGLPLSAPFFFFLEGLGFQLKDVYACKGGILLLEPHLQSIFFWLFWRGELEKYLLGLPQAMTLPSSQITDEPLEGPFSGCCLFYISLLNSVGFICSLAEWCNFPVALFAITRGFCHYAYCIRV